MAQEVRVAVVGAGRYASSYHIPNLLANPDAELCAICDTSSECREAIEMQTGVRTIAEFDKLLEEIDLDGVIISTPHALHYPQARQALERGLHVLVDKPFVLRVKEAQELVTLAKRQGLVLMAALNRHLDPANLMARQIIQSGRLGEPVFFRSLQVGYVRDRFYANPRIAGGGPLVGRASHMAALLPWMTGQRPVRLSANLRWGDLSVDLGGIVNLEMADGILAQIAAIADEQRYIDEIQVFGTLGSLTVARNPKTMRWELRLWDKDGKEVIPGSLPRGTTTTDHFVEVITGKEPSQIPLIDAIYSVAIVEGAYESARHHRPVEIEADGSIRLMPMSEIEEG